MPAANALPDDEALAALRFAADPLADDTVAAMLGPWPENEADNLLRLAAANRAIASWKRNADLVQWQAPAGTPEAVATALSGYVLAAQTLPAWADAALIRRAEQLFFDDGLLSCTLLFCASLPECYVLPDLAEVLQTTGQLEQRTEHRIRATAAMIFPVMLEGGLTAPEGGGVAQVLKVRLIHAIVRHLVLRGRPAATLNAGVPVPPRAANRQSMHTALLAHGWDTPAAGLPCNQLELAYTLLTFGYVQVRGMQTLGVPLDGDDARAVLHAWNVVGHLVGIPQASMVHDVPAAAALFERIQVQGRQHQPQPDPRPALARALIDTMAQALPLRLLRPLPVLLTRLLCGSAARSDLGLNQQVPWLARAAFTLGFCLVRGIDAIGRSIRPGFSIARLVTRVLGAHLLTRLLMDQTRPLMLPEHLLAPSRKAMAAWQEDRQAPRWLHRIEGRFTGAGPGSGR